MISNGILSYIPPCILFTINNRIRYFNSKKNTSVVFDYQFFESSFSEVVLSLNGDYVKILVKAADILIIVIRENKLSLNAFKAGIKPFVV